MDEMQFLGYAVTALITLGGFVAVIQKFTQPINELKIVIQELRDCIATLKENNATQNRRLDEHGKVLDDLVERVRELEVKMDLYHRKE